MLELVSIHIPKTGGTSLLQMLQAKYGLGLKTIYPPPGDPAWARLWIGTKQKAAALVRAPFPVRCVHGHVPAARYAKSEARMITFLRDPVEQRVSTWHYARRRHARDGIVANAEWRAAIDLELEDFLGLPAPVYSVFLRDVSPARFCFIGAMETFDDDMKRLSALLGAPYVPHRANANPQGSAYDIPGEWRTIHRRANPEDVRLYEAAMAERRRLLETP